jgi:threonine/homoserine/homoserine lactone efflux protein
VISFLLKAMVISMTGVMAPGPMTAATLAAAVRKPHAGAMVALGHAVIEMPLIFFIILVAQVARFLQHDWARIGIGLAGGAFLLWMGTQIIGGLRKPMQAGAPARQRSPLVSGIVLSAGNPYFLIWWATVGLALAAEARQWGVGGLAVFAVIHWTCDLVWLEALSLATFKGAAFLGERSHKIVLGVCAAAIIFFGEKFLYDAGGGLLHAMFP